MELLSQPDYYVGNKSCPKLCFGFDFAAVPASGLLTFADMAPNVFGEMFTIAGVKLEVGVLVDLTNNLGSINAQNLVDALNSHPEFFPKANASVVGGNQVLLVAYEVGYNPEWVFDVSDLSNPPTVTSGAGSNSDAPVGYRFHYQIFVGNSPYGNMANVPLLYRSGGASTLNQCFEVKLDLEPNPIITNGIPQYDGLISKQVFIRYGDSQQGIPCGTEFNQFYNTDTFNVVQGNFADWGDSNVQFLTRRERPIKVCNGSYESVWIVLDFPGIVATDFYVQYTFYQIGSDDPVDIQLQPFTYNLVGVYQIPINAPLVWPTADYMEVIIGGILDGSDEVVSEILRVERHCLDCKCFPIWYFDGGWSQMIFEQINEAEWVDEHETLEVASDCETCKSRTARLELKENFIVQTSGSTEEEFKRSMGVFLNSPKHMIYEYGQFKPVYLRPGSTNYYVKDRKFNINLRFDK